MPKPPAAPRPLPPQTTKQLSGSKKVHKAEWVEERQVRPAWLIIPSEILDGLQNCHSFQKLGEPSLLCPTLFLEVVVVREAKKFPLCHPFQIDAGWTVKRPTSLAQEWPGTNYLPLQFSPLYTGGNAALSVKDCPCRTQLQRCQRPGTDTQESSDWSGHLPRHKPKVAWKFGPQHRGWSCGVQCPSPNIPKTSRKSICIPHSQPGRLAKAYTLEIFVSLKKKNFHNKVYYLNWL